MKKLEFKELKKKLPKGINLVVKKKLTFNIFEKGFKKNEGTKVKGLYGDNIIYLTPEADYWTFYHERLHAYFDIYFWNYFYGILSFIFYWIEEVIVAFIIGIVKFFKEFFKVKEER